ncbi:SusC/RagA family TonB-linked outer membrane protein [Bacteroidia bacterium]|nr:SusC/RagA family TonB-linked outer membrane protein [Bacteroidia bacterium]
MKKLTYLLFCLIAGIGLVSAQTTRVTGKVTSADDGEPIIGASVLVKGTTTGVVTDADGSFTLNVPANTKILVISYVGMIAQEVAVKPNVQVELQSDTRRLEEVVVVAYGTTRREAKTGSITTVSNEELSDLVGVSFDKMLSGKMAGVQITATSGQPGAGSEIRIRGISSINAGNEPLYVVDGVAVMAGNQTYFMNTGNAIASINPNDIENITVLKDAAATSVYGSRAANGVILVTTKSGKSGKSRFNMRAKFGSSQLANDNGFGVMNRDELLEFRRQAAINAGFDPYQEGSRYYYPASMNSMPETDWIDHVSRPGKLQEYEISGTGGNERTSYFSSASYHKNEGVFYGVLFERYQARVNADHALTNTLKTGVRVNVAYTEADDVPMQSLYYVNPLFGGMIINPWTKPYNEDGTHNVNIPENSNSNPRATADFDKQWESTYRFSGNMYLQWTPLKGLVFRTTNAAELSASEGIRYWDAYTNRGTATLQSSTTFIRKLTTSNTATYDGTFNDIHSYRILAGQEAVRDDETWNYIYAPNVDSEMPYPQTAPVDGVEAEQFTYAKALLSYFGILDYNYASKYYLQASIRYDGSSLFGKNNIWGTFYSVGASWNAHNEAFLKEITPVNLLKLRASYGVNGNNDIEYYRQYGVYAPTQYNGFSGLRPSRPSNDFLSWERSSTWNAGIDFGFLQRFTGAIDVYSRKTTDMLLDRPLSRTSGFTQQTQNIGSVQNSGVEFQLDASVVNTKDIQWNIGFNLSHNKSKILDLAGDEMINEVDYTALKHIKGESLYTFYLRDYYGVNPVNGDPLFVTEDGKLTNNFNNARFIKAGSPEPKLTGGLYTNASWKGLSLNVQLEGKFGNKVLIGENRYLQHDGNQMTMNLATTALNYWKNPGDTGVNPKPVAGNTTSSYSNQTTRYLEKGDFVRIKDVTLAYNLPANWVKAARIGGAKVYCSGYNLYTFHDVHFWDPERGVRGMGNGIYPMTKSVLFGIDLSF